MAKRLTLERLLRDDDDASGQTIRQWHVERDGELLTIRTRADQPGFLLIRASDAALLCADITEMAATVGPAARPHKWVPSRLGHGTKMCSQCAGTEQELAALGQLDRCDMAPGSTPPPEAVEAGQR